MRTSIAKIEFESNLVLERSITPVLEDLGKAKCSMEFFTSDHDKNNKLDKSGNGDIVWNYEMENGDEDEIGIGIWWENVRITDYDGVFSLPRQAVQLLRKAGLIVGKDFIH